MRAQRRLRRSFQHDGVADGDSRGEFVGDKVDWKVEWGDRADEPNRAPRGDGGVTHARGGDIEGQQFADGARHFVGCE